jgi:hypothetical protein
MTKHITWIMSSFVTIVLMALLIQFIYHTDMLETPHIDELSTPKEVKNYLENYVTKYSPNNKPTFIPTGLFIQSLSFSNSNTVHASGHLWQKYTDQLLSTIKPGFIFPEAIGRSIINKAYEVKENGITTIGWHFDVNIVENFDYSKFPLDRKTVRFRIWHKEAKNIILTPDLESYVATKPYEKFGIDSKIVLRNFQLLNSYFNFKLTDYDTNFGVKSLIGQKNFPELHFNIDIKRIMLSVFITNFFPLLVVLVFTFLTLLITTTKEEDARNYGFTLSNILRVCSLFLFIVLLAHINLRNTISEGKFIYIEYIYFVLYASLLYVAINAFIVIKGSPDNKLVKFFEYEDNLLPKALFFPIILIFLLWNSVRDLG